MLNESSDQMKFFIKEEKLEIKKKWLQTGEINWHKEVIMEEKIISVPVMREELIINKTIIDSESQDRTIHTETIRIPLREERVEINKHIFDLDKVEIYKNQLQRTESFDVILKKEVVFLKTADHLDMEIREL